jgi:hypothetical protein
MNYKVHPSERNVTVFLKHGIEFGRIIHENNSFRVVFNFSDMAEKIGNGKFGTYDEAVAHVEEHVKWPNTDAGMKIEDFGEHMQIPKLKEMIFKLVAGKELNYLDRGIIAAIMDEQEPCCPNCGGYNVKEVGKLIWCEDCHDHFEKP